MATYKATAFLGLDYVRRFTAAYCEGTPLGQFRREALCEDVQFPAVLVAPRSSDLLAGKRIYPEVGYSLQYGGLGYYLNCAAWDAVASAAVDDPERNAWRELRAFWEKENTTTHCVAEFDRIDPEIRRRLPVIYTGLEDLNLPAYPLFRVAGLQLDYEKLVRLGLPGLEARIAPLVAGAADETAREFSESALASVRRVRRCAEHYRGQAEALGATAMQAALAGICDHAPRTFHEALQLVLLVSTLTGAVNFSRLDVVLGPLLCRDLDTGAATWADALRLMRNFYTIIEEEIVHFDGRIIVGGLGRDDEAAADRFALLAMETTESLSLPMPQLTLRFHARQNPVLLEKAYDVIGQGKTFPMLYNDEVNVPAVGNAFGVDRATALQYLPFSCGEYVIDHQSCGTPNAIINLPRCLESALNNGRCLHTGEVIGPDFGGLTAYPDFDALWAAYTRTVEYFLGPLARAQDSIYRTTGRECPFSLVSLLYDDCLDRGRPLFDGGVRFLGGTNETYGNTNVADSLTAIARLVYRERLCAAGELLDALRHDWQDSGALRRHFREAPKFGNDDHEPDAMVCRVHDHVCRATSAAAAGTRLHHFLVVVINNNHNTLWGKWTSALPDGRGHGDPLAPGNAPGAGCDRNGLTAVLNSQAKPDSAIHAGAVQNVRIGAALPRRDRLLYRALFNAYFAQGGAQAMVTVTDRRDLLDALEHPENHGNLLVRVGGFSARFIDLDRDTQREILSRMEHDA